MSNQLPLAVFTDFDGTVSRRDIGYHLYHHFSGGKITDIVARWKAGEITSRECMDQETALVRASKDEVYSFLDQFELNSGFSEFVAACRTNDVPLTILSDGLDIYIKYLLGRFGLEGVLFLSNVGRFTADGLAIEYPYPLGRCGRCGNCKGERITEYRANLQAARTLVFVGDGLSDTCALERADIVFAKKDLARYCAQNDFGYYEFDTFFDIYDELTQQGYLK